MCLSNEIIDRINNIIKTIKQKDENLSRNLKKYVGLKVRAVANRGYLSMIY